VNSYHRHHVLSGARTVLARVGPVDRSLDVGVGDGWLTMPVEREWAFATASPPLMWPYVLRFTTRSTFTMASDFRHMISSVQSIRSTITTIRKNSWQRWRAGHDITYYLRTHA
jgi:hypothetical protein